MGILIMVNISRKKPALSVTITLRKADNTTVKKSFPLVSNGYTLYFNAQHHLVKLNNKERALFDFLCERVAIQNNDIYIDRTLKLEFIELITSITSTKVKLTEDMVNNYIQKLNDMGLILRGATMARYTVNPKYAFRGTIKDRVSCLGNLIEARIAAKLPIAALINESEEEFLK